MPVTRRIYVSTPADKWLDDNQNALKWGVVDRIVEMGYLPEIFTDPKNHGGLASGLAWGFDNVDKVARRSVGAAIIGLPRWVFETRYGNFRLPTEYCHYEGAVANTLDLPTLVVAEDALAPRGIFIWQGHYIASFTPGAGPEWLELTEFNSALTKWKKQLSQRRDIFLGYCSGAEDTAHKVKAFLKTEGATVLDWQEFPPGGSILEQIEDATARCSAGVFLFTRDDELAGEENRLAPRDNVVLEAGFFAHAKGKERVLIIREQGAKMPADLGGNIYASLDDRADITTIENDLRKFLEHRV